ncbi:lysophospholipid acyltransferase family protein [Candidatus Pelagibacter sp.]|jgi:KDO2-lipid IV(A) lauroyltransferase|nr:lysophospholipid acyltransferase family protein [Candidatus Pelagibacter sp.]MDC0448254.1 lysophospholipid acyltransferase family protein [Candidatus Pelagibacter sp.]
MSLIKYLIQFITISFLLVLFRMLGFKIASNISSKIFTYIGPLFRSKNLIKENIIKAYPKIENKDLKKIINGMWGNYGRILSEYVFMKNFRNSKLSDNIIIKGQEILDKIKSENKPVIFISGHFNNFELMAMHIEKSGLEVAAIYRPLNNKFLNFFMEKIRKKFICKHQIKKGISGTKKILNHFKNGTSIALMIDQRLSQGIKTNFFNQEALTTTIPAQFVKKFNCKIVPIYIERINKFNFALKVYEPISYSKDETIHNITSDLNKILEKMILKNPEQWIWSHNRWKV